MTGLRHPRWCLAAILVCLSCLASTFVPTRAGAGEPQAIPGDWAADPFPEASAEHTAWAMGSHAWDRERFWQDVDLSLADHGAFYSRHNLALLGLGIGAMAPVANTSADRSLRDGYQDHIRNGISDDFADAVNFAGQMWVVVPLAVEISALLGHGPDDYRTAGGFREWGNRSLRAVAVGYPPTVALYGLLGSTRPAGNDSRWHPFQNFHGVSGHTFIGAIPFLTAASMTDEPLLRAPLVAGSFLTGWSRLHLDRHYFSQVALGWWLAYLSVRSVNATQAGPLPWTLVPLAMPEGTGVGVYVEY